MITAVFSAALMLTACEKDNVNSPSQGQDFTKNNSKSKTINNKSGDSFPDDYWDDLSDFVTDVMDDNSLSSMEFEKALYYTESAQDYQLTFIQSSTVASRVMGDELDFQINIQSGQTDLSATELEELNNDIYDDIANQASILANSENDTVAIETVDLTWDINATNIQVHANVLYSIGFLPPVYCIYQHRQAGYRLTCTNPAYATTEAAHELIDQITRPLSCGTWNDKLNCSSNQVIVNIRQSVIDGNNNCGFGMYSGASSTCRNYANNSIDHDNAQDAWNNNCSSISNNADDLRTVYYDGVNPSIGSVDFEATYVTGKCVSACPNPICSVPQKPRKGWGNNGDPIIFP